VNFLRTLVRKKFTSWEADGDAARVWCRPGSLGYVATAHVPGWIGLSQDQVAEYASTPVGATIAGGDEN